MAANEYGQTAFKPVRSLEQNRRLKPVEVFPFIDFLWFQSQSAVAILGCLVIVLAYRASQQRAIAKGLDSTNPKSIHAALFVRIGGIDQAIQIRGDDAANPVILILHGGPGISMMAPAPVFRSWEKYFTLVQWDQRGAGKTYGRHKDKFIVLGHSWGTVLALKMVKLRPLWFTAYVGTGQLVDKKTNEGVAYEQLLARIRDAGDAKGKRALQVIGPPPYKNLDDLIAARRE